MNADGYWQAAKQKFEDERGEVHREMNFSDGPNHQAAEALRGSGVVTGVVFQQSDPWDALNDRYWFDKPAMEVQGADGGGLYSVVCDLDSGESLSAMHIVGTCGFCGQPSALDPPFTDLVSLWEARQYGTPVHHTCRNQRVE